MLEWLKRAPSAKQKEVASDAAEPEAAPTSGRSAPLHKYLDDRYADAVILTFAEIEDLIGFALPAVARVNDDWWATPGPDATHSRFADSWILAKRTARPNLRALTVAFDRTL